MSLNKIINDSRLKKTYNALFLNDYIFFLTCFIGKIIFKQNTQRRMSIKRGIWPNVCLACPA